MKPRITVVGSVNMDLVFRTPRIPALGETIQGREFLQIPGGKGANQAVAAARQGAEVTFIGAIGDDGFGVVSRNCLDKEGIKLMFLNTMQQVATGVAGILVEDAGDNMPRAMPSLPPNFWSVSWKHPYLPSRTPFNWPSSSA
jgi:ribokinase